MFADLHLHSIFSDGTDTPMELCTLVQAKGIKIMSITDHDSVEGVKQVKNDPYKKPADIIPGIEISTICNHKYLHMLGYFIDINNEDLSDYIKFAADEKTENTRVNFENALSLGIFSYPWERVLKINKDQPRISGVHVVKAMEYDHFTIDGMSLWDMFHKHFWAESPGFLETETMTGYDAVDIILKANGLPVLAHPKSVGNDDTIHDLINHGVKGLEVYHPIHSKSETEKYLQMSIDNRLLITGGSDWHGRNNGAEAMPIGTIGLENDKYEILHLFKDKYL